MKKHILVPKYALIVFLFTYGICFSQTDSITAKYCFYSDTTKSDLMTIDSVWKLFVYEQVIPLTITIQTKSNQYMSSMNAQLNSNIEHLHYLIFFGPGASIFGSVGYIFGSAGACAIISSNGRRYKCALGIYKEYYIYDYLNFLYEKENLEKISILFDKVFSLQWSLDFSMDGQKQTLSGTHSVYILGICTEDQLKQVKERLKEKEERENNARKQRINPSQSQSPNEFTTSNPK